MIEKHIMVHTHSMDAKFDSFCFSQVEDVEVEVVRATILLQLQDDVLAVDGTVACTLSWSL